MNKAALYLFVFFLASCTTEKKKSPTVYFAGEIVNPTSDFVVLHKDDVVIDSAKLDENNRFSFSLESIEEGLYHYDHAPEMQYLFLQHGDSLLVRLNTIDFDESLVFSGTGAELNNFLVEVFLANEEEEQLINTYYKLDPISFASKIDSLRNTKLNILKDLKSEVALTEKAYEMALASINYTNFSYKEKYPFYHKKRTGEKTVNDHDLHDNFYSYRNQLSFDNKNLTYFRPYYNFMKIHFGNLSYMSCSAACGVHKHTIKNPLHFNRHTLKLIDSIVMEKDLKDNLFRNVAMDYLLKAKDNEENHKIFIDEFLELSGNNKHINEIKDLYQGIKNVQPNQKVPKVEVYGLNETLTDLQTISTENKNVVFYFWSGTQKRHFEDTIRRVETLSAKHPEYTFVGINYSTEALRWRSMLESKKLDQTIQFRSNNTEELVRSLILDYPNKSIITKDGRIVNAFANIYDSF